MSHLAARVRTAVLCVAALSCAVAFDPRGMTASRASAQDQNRVVAVVNARNPTPVLPSKEATKLFLGRTAFWHGVVPVKLLLRPDNSEAARVFCPTVLNMTPAGFRKHWQERQLSGRGQAPEVLGTIQEIAAAVAKVPGAISFALQSEAWQLNVPGVRVIAIQ